MYYNKIDCERVLRRILTILRIIWYIIRIVNFISIVIG